MYICEILILLVILFDWFFIMVLVMLFDGLVKVVGIVVFFCEVGVIFGLVMCCFLDMFNRRLNCFGYVIN